MSKTSDQTPAADVPFGADPKRSKALVWILGVLYAAWFVFLLAMAILQSTR
ncbi:MAG: hypothetical protein JXO22_02290 [Phycisphaerae bacterium]|nr:hypothetical protein [Phycisphaerae bacterium]